MFSTKDVRSRAGALAATRFRIAAITATLIMATGGCAPESEIDGTRAMLTRIREEKQEQLADYFDVVNQRVAAVRDDPRLLTAFDGLHRLYRGADAAQTASVYDQSVMERYIEAYQLFFDIHFIAADGQIFYTLLKQDNLFGNLFSPEFAGWNLSSRLRDCPQQSAVDFQVVDFSSEPSAFFAEPVVAGGEHRGWIVLQYASSRLNELFGYDSELGATGEVFLVNRSHFMMTRSQNSPGESALQRHLSDENIERKFAEGSGELEVIDYRGYRCLTSFAVAEVLDFTWLLVAKIDYAEAMTREYLAHDRRYYQLIRDELRRAPSSRNSFAATTERAPDRETVRVYLDNYERVTGAMALETPGVATCTSVVIALPGEFAYMAHISPYDRIYDGTRTDLVSSMLRQIRQFELPDKRLRELEVTLVTPEIRYSDSLITEFAEAGIFLSQITIMKNPGARCADVHYDLPTNTTYATWYDQMGDPLWTQSRENTPTVGNLMESLL